jgi:hypothetical protein
MRVPRSFGPTEPNTDLSDIPIVSDSIKLAQTADPTSETTRYHQTLVDESTAGELNSTSSIEAPLHAISANISSESQLISTEKELTLTSSSTVLSTRSATDTFTSPISAHIGNHSAILLNHASTIQEDDLENYQLDANTQFLSFEEWKRQKGVDSHKESDSSTPLKSNKPSIPKDNGIIGEEMEIDLSNFFAASSEDEQEEEGRLYKDKFNYASFDCAATIVKTNSEAKGAISILFENKDSYLLNPCSAPNKFVVIEMCEDILVDSFVIANLEFFSSTFKKVALYVSDSFPIQKNGWTSLGVFDAQDVRDYQTFDIKNPKIWAKYVKIEIIEHYGNEFYCPLTVVRVHGRTMMQEYKQEENLRNVEKEKSAEQLEARNEGNNPNEDNSLKEPQGIKLEQRSSSSTAKVPQSEECKKTSCEEDEAISVDGIQIKSNDFNLDLVSSMTPIDEVTECTLPSLKFDELFKKNKQCELWSHPELKSELEESESFSSISSQQLGSPPQNPGTQESIYKNIMKRLSLLESNATLSVLYIEEQSKLLSNAFTNLEKRHANNLNKLISTFNDTVNDQIQSLSSLYHTLQEETLVIFTNQRSNHELLLNDAYSQINQLSSELKFQKFLAILNFVIIVSVLIYVFLTRDTYIDTEYVENDKVWYSQHKQRLASTGSRIKANIKKYYYNSDGGTLPNSPELSDLNSEDEGGHFNNGRFPSMNPVHFDHLQNNGVGGKLKEKSSDFPVADILERPPTPQYSDVE